MNRLKRMADGLRTFQKDISLTLRTVITDNEAIIIDMNAEDQLFEKGENRLEVSISDYAPYSPITIDYKKEKGQPYDRVTLRDEGDFEQSFYLQITNEGFEVKAGDWKAEELTQKYGTQIMGLNDRNTKELIWEIIFPLLAKYLRESVFNT